MPCRWSSFLPLSFSIALPPRSRMPSSTAARVACMASSTRSLRGRATDPDHGNPARELREPLLQLLAIVIGGGLLDLCLDLGDARLDFSLLASAADDRGVLLLDHHLLGTPEHVERDLLELDAEVLG